MWCCDFGTRRGTLAAQLPANRRPWILDQWPNRRPWILDQWRFAWFPRTELQLRVLTHLFLSFAFLRRVAAILWLLDEWLYPEYRQVEIKAPIIIVSVPREGTTSFHRTIALDEDQLVTPTMLELALPFSAYKRSSGSCISSLQKCCDDWKPV